MSLIAVDPVSGTDSVIVSIPDSVMVVERLPSDPVIVIVMVCDMVRVTVSWMVMVSVMKSVVVMDMVEVGWETVTVWG